MSTKEKLEFVFLMAKHSDARLNDLQRLMRFAATHQRIATDQCNGPDYDHDRNDAQRNATSKRWQEYQDKLPMKKIRIQRKIVALCSGFNSKPVFAAVGMVKIQVPDGYTNDWGKEGICVPA